MMSKMQRDKGARFERWTRQQFEYLYNTTLSRGQQRAGALQPDVIAPDWWIECTVGKNPRVYAKIHQSERDLKSCAHEHRNKKPLIIHKKDREDVWVTLRWKDFVELLQNSQSYQELYYEKKEIPNERTRNIRDIQNKQDKQDVVKHLEGDI
mgnify:CR=1 FL=1